MRHATRRERGARRWGSGAAVLCTATGIIPEPALGSALTVFAEDVAEVLLQGEIGHVRGQPADVQRGMRRRVAANGERRVVEAEEAVGTGDLLSRLRKARAAAKGIGCVHV